MNVFIQSVLIALWVCTFTFVRGQECTIEEFKQKHPEGYSTSGLLKSYPDQHVLRVPCATGYEGFHKITCSEGKWLERGQKCARKQCGHPGDSPYADFSLLAPSKDFSFGSQVVYTCKPGYEMQTRSSIRTCQDQGWSNTVPVCEPIPCPALNIDDNVLAYGEYEDATYGGVISFNCKSSKMRLVGNTEIDCNDKGQWSGEVPTCEVFKCDVPQIDNGSVKGPLTQYNEHDILPYECDPLYKREMNSQNPHCVRVGNSAQWNPTPRCEEIKCELTQIQPMIYTPSDKRFFVPGLSLIVECPNNYWIAGSDKKTSKTVKCDDKGNWMPDNHVPICEEIKCAPPTDPAIQRISRGKIGTIVQFTCAKKYKLQKGDGKAVCTKDGWRPYPDCKEITCDPKDLQNAQLLNQKNKYGIKDEIEYQCMGDLQNTHIAVCTEKGWEYEISCLGIKDTCNSIKNGFVVEKISETNSKSSFYYSCNEGYKIPTGEWWNEAECEAGNWIGPTTCIEKSKCSPLPKVLHTSITSEEGYEGQVPFKCEDGYTSEMDSITCKNGAWVMPLPKCLPSGGVCNTPPKVENAVVEDEYHSYYVLGLNIKYKCRKGYQIIGNSTIRCVANGWEPAPTCKKDGIPKKKID